MMSGKRVFVFACIALVVGMIIGVSSVEYGRRSAESRAEPVVSVFAEEEAKAE